MILVSIPQLSLSAGEPIIAGYPSNQWFQADGFAFAISRPDEPSGSRNGPELAALGPGAFHDVSIMKALDQHSTLLAQFAASGGNVGLVEVDFVDPPHVRAEAEAMPYLRYSFQRCFVASWTASAAGADHPTEQCSISFEEMSIKHWVDGDPAVLQMSWDLRNGGPA